MELQLAKEEITDLKRQVAENSGVRVTAALWTSDNNLIVILKMESINQALSISKKRILIQKYQA